MGAGYLVGTLFKRLMMNRLAGLFFLFCYCQWFIPTTWAQTYVAGNSYIDSTGYIEYLAGDLP